MIKGLFDRLLGTTEDSPRDEDARLAMIAVLVRIARADHDYAEVEKLRIDAISQARYGLDKSAAMALRAEAELLEAEAPDTVRFTRVIKEAVPYDERQAVLQTMWSVVLADNTRDTHEDVLMRMVANLLGVSDRDSALARQQAASQ
ncbi:TerB family tellurite resistance protein [Lentibacter algarum]|uniref:tellurite resistance TerB family protein n=1 Tax=Lentibacter algarum TaxID=576131 RepID=UPI001C085500|nr:TerB family tellurite resistance protein [Lentibacter algarum]MBU2982758.1 TerB family tellurite resistance protein [Lentibacter algarum]